MHKIIDFNKELDRKSFEAFMIMLHPEEVRPKKIEKK